MSKTFESRFSEVKNIYQKLNELGIVSQEFKQKCNDFVKLGVGSSGKIKLNEAKRDLIYILSTQPHIISNVTLKSYCAV